MKRSNHQFEMINLLVKNFGKLNKDALNDIIAKIAIESTDVFIGIFDLEDSNFSFVNISGLNLFGSDHKDTFNGHIAARVPVLLEKIAKRKDLDRKEIELIALNGSSFYGELTLRFVEYNHRLVALVYLVDISTSRFTKKKLEEIEARFEAIFQHAAIGVILIDKSQQILLVNSHLCHIFGYSEHQLLGQPLEILIPDSIKSHHRGLQQKYVHKPTNRPMGIGLDLKAQHKDGSLFPVEISLSHFSNDVQHFYVAFVNNISIKKQSEQILIEKNEEIKRLNEALEIEVAHRTEDLILALNELKESKKVLEQTLTKERELSELKSRFVSMASHEFRTPLTSINTATNLISKYTQTEDQDKREKYLDKIKSAIGNLKDILEEFLSVGRLEEGKIEAKKDHFNIEDLINETVQDLTPLFKPGQQIDYKHEGTPMVHIDKSLLRKIVLNLCTNALKFSHPNSVIHLKTSFKNSLTLVIEDQGIGISKEDQKHLFDRFYRATNAANIQGTGLGLYIVAKFTDLMGGKIDFKSDLGLGTTISISF